MAAFADLTINDGAATPVARTFKVKKVVGTISSWEERSGGIPVGYWRLQSETKESDQVRRVKIKTTLPVLEAVSGANSQGFTPASTVAYSNGASSEFILSQRSSLQDRKHLYAIHCNALAMSLFGGLIKDGDEIAG